MIEGDDYADEEQEVEERSGLGLGYRGARNDPTFGYLITLALALGLAALPAEQRDLRYTVLWLLPAAFGVLAWLFGDSERVYEEAPESLAWGLAFALIIATPLLAVGGTTLNSIVNALFQGMSPGTLLAYLIFVMPLAETLFFRGVLQQERSFWLVGLMATLWNALVFLPSIGDIGRFPVIAFMILVTLAMMNLTFSYVRQRNGLAAAWTCQIIVNLVLVFIPFIQ
jgi:membrane protease YdiL (CAAX protease family)